MNRRIAKSFLVVITIVGGLVYLIRPAYQKVRESALRSQCSANLKQIALAVNAYYEEHRSYPPAYILDDEGQPVHSWRVLLLPHLGQQELFDAYRFDEPWDGPNNRKLAARMPPEYACPSDTQRSATTTNYCAVVSSVSAWPEHEARRAIRATSQTILLVESCDSNIHWMEPRDLTIAQAVEGINPATSPSISSHHGDVALCAFCDTNVRSFSTDTDEDILFALLTADGGKPYPGLPFPAELEADIGEFAEIADASEFPATDMLPFTSGPLRDGRNYVYCATFQLAWDKGRQSLGLESIDLEGAPDFAVQLDATRFPLSDLASDSYIAVAGVAGSQIERAMREELSAKFPNVAFPELPTEGLVTYAYLEKNLPFEAKFKTRKEPLTFRSGETQVAVKSFGFEDVEYTNSVTQQVNIHDYTNKHNFVIRISTESDDIVLAKVPPAATLQETLAQVRRRIMNRTGVYQRRNVDERDTLIIPKINFGIDRRYSEIVNRTIMGTGLFVGEAKQLVRFKLNEAGARLISQSIGGWFSLDDEEPEDPDAPRDMRFDKPFLLYLQEKRVSEPYLVVWIGNDELLVNAD